MMHKPQRSLDEPEIGYDQGFGNSDFIRFNDPANSKDTADFNNQKETKKT